MAKTITPATGRADERARKLATREGRALESAARWLRRRGDARENSETKRAYTTAAKRIHELTRG